jgi:hypothetical protein
LFTGHNYHATIGAVNDYGDTARQFFLRRAKLRLDGVPEGQIPPLPQECPLTEAEVCDLQARFGSVIDRQQAVDVFSGLDYRQMYLFPAFLKAHPNLNSRLRQLANTITAVDVNSPGLDRVIQLHGHTLSMSLIEQLRAICQQQANAGRRI